MPSRAEMVAEHAAEMVTFREMAAEGKNSREIGARLGLTTKAVRERARVAGILLTRVDATCVEPCACHGLVSNARDTGHHYGPHLRCTHCGEGWHEQQRNVTLCEGAG